MAKGKKSSKTEKAHETPLPDVDNIEEVKRFLSSSSVRDCKRMIEKIAAAK